MKEAHISSFLFLNKLSFEALTKGSVLWGAGADERSVRGGGPCGHPAAAQPSSLLIPGNGCPVPGPRDLPPTQGLNSAPDVALSQPLPSLDLLSLSDSGNLRCP